MHQAVHAETPAPASILRQPPLSNADIERALVRGRKMRSEAFWTLLKAIGGLFAKAARGFAEYRRTQRAIAELRGMDLRLLADIGLTPGDIDRAANFGRNRAEETPRGTLPSVANDAEFRRKAA